MSIRLIRLRTAVVLACVCAVGLLAGHAQAVDFTFDPLGGGSADWWVNGNWTPGGFPNSVNDRAIFNASANASYSTNTHPSSPYRVREMRFDTSSNWRIHNNERDIYMDAPSGNALITQNGSGTVTYDSDWILIDNTVLGGTGSGQVILNGSILTGPGQRRGIWGAGSLTKEGSFTATVNPAGSYSGGTTINQGTIVIGNNAALGTGPVQINAGGTLNAAGTNPSNNITLNGGTLYMSNATSGQITLNNVAGNRIYATGNYRTVSGKITGPGGFTVGGVSTPGVTLTNPANDFGGNVSINGGSYLRLTADEVIPNTADVTIGGFLRLEGANRTETIDALNGGGKIFEVGAGNTTLRVGAGNGSGSFSGQVGADWDGGARSINLAKTGTGTQSMSGRLYHTGSTTVDGGVLRLHQGGLPMSGTGQFNSPQTVTVNNGGTLQLNNNWVVGDGVQNQVVVNEGGTLQFLNADNYLSRITLTGGAITTSGGNRPWRTGNFGPGVITVNASATTSTVAGSLCFVGTPAGPTTTFNVAGGGTADVSSHIFDHPGFEGRMRLVKTGAGTLRLTNAGNSWDGGLSINGGTVSTPQLTSGNTNGALGGWSGTSAYFSFNGGTLEYTGGSVGGINRAFTINAGGAMLDIANAAATVTWTDAAGAGPITGPGRLTKAGPGTLVLAGNNNYAGGTTVSQGTLYVQNNNGLGSGLVTLGDANTGANDVRIDMLGSTSWPGGPSHHLDNNINVSNLVGGEAIIAGVGGTYASVYRGTITLQNKDVVILHERTSDRTAIEGKITGTGNVRIECVGGRVNWTNAGNDFVGDVTITPGSTLQVNAGGVIPNASDVTVDGRMGFYSSAETIDALKGSGVVNLWPGWGSSTLTVGADNGSDTFSGQIQGAISLVKTGTGTQTLSGVNTYTGTTNVNNGTLIVDESIAGGVTVGPDGILGGGGTVGAVTGDGTISPGASPGILTAPSINASTGTGMDFAFEFTAFGTTLGVENDVLALTDPTSPFSGNLMGATNMVDIYLNVTSLSLNDTFRGGFFTKRDVDFLDAIRNADFSYYVKGDGLGSTPFGGENYYTLGEYGAGWNVTLTTEVQDDGVVMQLQAVPEPITMLAIGLSLAGLGGYVRKRRS